MMRTRSEREEDGLERLAHLCLWQWQEKKKEKEEDEEKEPQSFPKKGLLHRTSPDYLCHT